MQTPDKARNARLVKKYGITLDEYAVLFENQGGACKICKREPTGRALHVDHDHKLRYLKVESVKTYDGWRAGVIWGPRPEQFVVGEGKTKSEAIQNVRFQLKRASVRGLLCARCNMGLEKFSDNPDRLRSAAKYLEEYQNG